jgi:autotransporter-associated beta strand protein
MKSHFHSMGGAMLALLFVMGFLITPNTACAVAEADLLVSWDQTYPPTVGGDDNAQVLAANAVAGSNAVNDRSGTGARVRICGFYQAAQYSYQRTSKSGFVGWMSGYDSRISDVVDAGNARGADLVTFLCVTTSDGAAAVAQQPGRFSCFDPGQFWTAVVAHELAGHNYGCDHRGGKGDAYPKTVMMHNYCSGGGASPPYFYSNPNIWLGGARLQGSGSCLGTAVNNGDNAYLISTTAQGVADRYTRVVTAPNLGNVVRRWSFDQAAGNAPAGTTITDSITGTALATVQGSGATFTGKGLRIPGGASGSTAAYLQLPGALISGYTNATIEIWAKELSVQNWARLLDFNNGTSNYILLSAAVATDLNSQRFESKVGGATVSLDSGLPTAVGVLHHYAITYTSTGASTGRWQWYRDGDAVAYLNVAYPLSSLQDVNNWLGRSAYASDAFANCEYAEVRVSNVSMTRDQVAANARLGPNRVSTDASLATDDAIGQSSFNAAANWSDGSAPASGKSYDTYGFRLRTPADGSSRTFAGQSLKLTGGSFIWKGTSSSTITVNDLTLAGDDNEILNAGSGTFTLAGNLKVNADETQVRANNGTVNLSANLSGDGALLCTLNTVTLSGTNTDFTGKVIVGDGRTSGLSISSEARLGPNPSSFIADQLTLNRGVFYANSSMTIDDANRGIRIGASAGIFNVASGATLTVAVPVSGTSSGDTLLTAPISPNPVSGMLIKENAGSLVFTHPNNSHAGEIIINGGEMKLDGAGRFNNGSCSMPVVINGTLTLNTTADQTFSGAVSGSGSLVKGSTGTTSLTVANTFSGAVTINGGTLYANTTNAANNRALSYASGITVNSGGTLRTSSNALFGWDGTQEKPITINAGGVLAANGGLGSDVGLGTVTLNGGTISTLATGATDYGSLRFDEATDKLAVTADSTVSATNVKFGNASASIDVAAGKTLNFTGTITDATSGGISYLTKNGTGTLALTGTNTYTGATALNAGTTRVMGSLAAGTSVTVASGATLSGTGTLSGAVSFATGAFHAPGNPTGTQTIGGTLSYASGSRVRWSLPSNSEATNIANRISAGTVSVTSGALVDLVLNASGSAVNFNNAFWTQSHTWVLMTSSAKSGDFSLGSITGDANGVPITAYGSFSLQQSATATSVVYTPSPTALWRQANFAGNWNNAAVSGDDVDGDKDGLSNLLEYALGSDPNASTAASAPQVSVTGNKLRITFQRNTAASDIQLIVTASDSLSGPWTPIASSVNGAAFTVLAAGATVQEQGSSTLRTVQAEDIYIIPDPAHPKRFMRLEVQR